MQGDVIARDSIKNFYAFSAGWVIVRDKRKSCLAVETFDVDISPFPYREASWLVVAYLENSQKAHKITAKYNFAQLTIDILFFNNSDYNIWKP